ncbi:hypothetical protein NW768_011165 [Fusarium equiseti]|uniref:Mandelate racemase/muconate lactonizing enzyme C-terminal domain-containing protein n=1 Tax=Fusarium equiseti TaxID=61235 RepID=A0ABQ8QY26_FUSEQ|nr:hypothetical protein NW768_011165 [Fusarium equiseti]
MQIKDVTVFTYSANYRYGTYSVSHGRLAKGHKSIVVRICSDDGFGGWAETASLGSDYLASSYNGELAAIHEFIPRDMGLDPRSPAAICNDILGKSLGLPTAVLFGGRLTKSPRVFCVIGIRDPDAEVKQAQDELAKGAVTMQLKAGDDPVADSKRVKGVGATLPDHVIIRVDANGGWTMDQALTFTRAIGQDIPVGLEQPCRTLSDCAELGRRTGLPIMLDERIITVADLFAAHAAGGITGVNIKPPRVGGLTKACTIRDVAAAIDMVIDCDDTWGGALATVQNVLLATTTPDHRLRTVDLMSEWIEPSIADIPRMGADGRVTASSRPGNGYERIHTDLLGKTLFQIKFISEDDFNISRALDDLMDQVQDEIYNLRTEVANYTKEYVDQVTDDLDDGFDMDDFDLPTMDFDLNIDLPQIPEFRLESQFDELEVYMLVDTVLSSGATYTLNLYTSTTPAGFAVRHNLEVGVIFTIDLILSAEGEIDISTGFHLKLDDGVKIELAVFSKEISNMAINGGQFEFLPVTVESAGVVLKAALRVGIQAGFEISSSDVSIAGKDIFRISAGIEMGVYANIAELITNVTLSMDEDDQCGLRAEEAYRLAVGAAAGASIAIEDITWGPAVETEVPIFYTTLAQACVMPRSSGTIPAPKATLTSAALEMRGKDEDEAEMETITISEEATFIAVACESEGLVNCPASLQTTSRYTTTRTHVTIVPTDSEASFPESVRFTSVRPIPFGDSAKKLFTTSGIPRSYVPQPPTHSATASTTDDAYDGNEDNSSDAKSGRLSDSVIIGLSIGLGVPFLFSVIAFLL